VSGLKEKKLKLDLPCIFTMKIISVLTQYTVSSDAAPQVTRSYHLARRYAFQTRRFRSFHDTGLQIFDHFPTLAGTFLITGALRKFLPLVRLAEQF
jgi:hypothetical protein